MERESVMNRKIGTLLLVLVAVVAFAAVPAVWAQMGDCSVSVEGTVTSIDTDAQGIEVDGQFVKGIPLTYLANQYNIVLVEGSSYVVITARECMLTDGINACTLAVDGGAVIVLPGK